MTANSRSVAIRWIRDVHHVMRAGVDAEELDVHHVRDPRERMPVAGITGCERPLDIGGRETGDDVRVLDHVLRVVEVDEVVVANGRVDEERQRGEDEGGKRPRPARG